MRKMRQERMIQMPFGKLRGAEVDDLKHNSLVSLWKNVNLYEPLRSKIRCRLYEDPIHARTECGCVAALSRRIFAI